MKGISRFLRFHANSILAVSTIILVFATIGYNRSLLRDQREFNVATLRPYVVFEGAGLLSVGNQLLAGINWKNVGKTPAIRLETNYSLNVYQPDGSPAVADRADDAFSKLAKIQVLKAGFFTLPSDVPLRIQTDRLTVTPKALQAARTHPWSVVLVVQATYSDLFGGKYETDACVYGQGDIQLSLTLYCPIHNDSR
jgi:hypothetical protein